MIINILILIYFNQIKKLIFKINNLNYVMKNVFSQINNNEKLYLMIFFSKNFFRPNIITKFIIKNFLSSFEISKFGNRN
jgi:hypothetical protein